MTAAGRRLSAAVVTALASLAMLVTLLAHQADQVLVNSSSFSDRAVRVVRTPAVDSLVVAAVTHRLLSYVGDQANLQPIVEEAVHVAVSDRRITGEVRAAAGSLDRELLSGNANTLTLTLPDVGASIAPRIQPVSPQLAAAVTRIGAVTVLDVPIPPAAASAIHSVARLAQEWPLLLVATVALVLLALIISPRRRRTVLALGLGAAVSGLLAAALYLAGRGLIVNQFSTLDGRAAAQAAWDIYSGGLETAGFVLAGIGAVVAAGAALS